VNLAVHGSADGWNSIIRSNGWVTMTPEGGTQTTASYQRQVPVSVQVAENTEEEARSCEICLFTPQDRVMLTVNQAPIVREGCGELSVPEITFATNHYEYQPVSITTYEDVEVELPANSWIQTAEVPEGIIAAKDKVQFYVAPDGPSVTSRTETITFKGKRTGKITSLTINQEPIAVVDAFPARWYYDNNQANASGWLSTGNAPANYDAGKSAAVITAVGVNNRRIGHTITTTYKQSTGVSNLYTGDYILYSFPAKSLPAGTGVDFMMAISANDNTAPKYWVAEILDGGQWCKPQASDLKQINGEDYSFYTKYFSSYQHCTFLQSFTLNNAVTDGLVQVRCRVVSDRNGADGTLSPTNTGAVYLPSHEFHLCTMAAYPGIPVKDVKKVAILGNSFTHYFGSYYLLKELARSQGHQLDVRAFAKGSQYFNNHMTLERSKNVTDESNYDYVILQEQSTYYSEYYKSPKDATVNELKAMTARFREKSPNARIILENTWAFPKSSWQSYGSSAKFEETLLAGTRAVAQLDPNTNFISPIGVAFDAAYTAGITDLWYTDSKHPNRNGAYLKSCVNYLMIFGEPFNANASNGGCDPTVAARLRAIAEQTVLGHQTEYTVH
ncbi:MAG: hypothetical protein K2M65_06875, partial [Muribaculaceae bacterium]|nr:hypothetical protein [Muribaculaceae bacterium]